MECIKTIRTTSISGIRSMSRRVATKKCLIASMKNFLIAISFKLPSTHLAQPVKKDHTTETVILLSSLELIDKNKSLIIPRPQLLQLRTRTRLQAHRILSHLHLHLLLEGMKMTRHLRVTLIQHQSLKSQICLPVSSRMEKLIPTQLTHTQLTHMQHQGLMKMQQFKKQRI